MPQGSSHRIFFSFSLCCLIFSPRSYSVKLMSLLPCSIIWNTCKEFSSVWLLFLQARLLTCLIHAKILFFSLLLLLKSWIWIEAMLLLSILHVCIVSFCKSSSCSNILWANSPWLFSHCMRMSLTAGRWHFYFLEPGYTVRIRTDHWIFARSGLSSLLDSGKLPYHHSLPLSGGPPFGVKS